MLCAFESLNRAVAGKGKPSSGFGNPNPAACMGVVLSLLVANNRSRESLVLKGS
jgi:hypothetical protein